MVDNGARTGRAGRTGHAARGPRTTLHAPPHVRQCRPMFRKVRFPPFFFVLIFAQRFICRCCFAQLSTPDVSAGLVSHPAGQDSARFGAGSDGPCHHLLPGRLGRVHSTRRRR